MNNRKPYFRKSCNAFYVLWDGKQTWLGKSLSEANENLARLKADQPIVRESKSESVITFRQLAGEYLDFTKENRSEKTYKFYQFFLKPFVARYGNVDALKITPDMVRTSFKSRGYKDTTANHAVRSVVRVFNWAIKERGFQKNPIKGMERPAQLARGDTRECYITQEGWQRVLDELNADDPFKDYIVFLMRTGARPQEVRAIEARHLSGNNVVFPKTESKGKKQERVITLTSDALEIAQRLVSKHPVGPIFRNTKGNPWKKDALNCRFQRLKKKLAIDLFPYAIRHTYCTDAIESGIDPVTVATLMGHVDTTMVMRVYNKIKKRNDHMLNAAEKIANFRR